MSGSETEFLKSWIDQNITSFDKGGNYIRAMELADKCRASAATLGIRIDEKDGRIRVLETIIHDAIHHRAGTASG
jgi:hypothetical protein